jgi:tetratricopeptide (TPR) repeat protein
MEAVRIDPNNGHAWFTVGTHHYNAGRLEDARHNYARAERAFGADDAPPELAYAHARTLAAMADRGGDKPDEERALRLDALRHLESAPDSADTHVLAARQHERLRDPAAADLEYRAAIRSEPRDVRAYALLGAMYLDHGFEDEGLVVLRRGTEVRPDDPRVWTALGRGQAIAHAFEASVEAYDHALALDEAAYDARFGLAMAHLELGHWFEATSTFEAYLRKPPLDRPIHVRVAEHRLAELHLAAFASGRSPLDP